MGKALYRKYRSKLLSEIIGQDHITNTLSNALENGQISHAYLLTGPRGVGKTSIARILAHEINNLPYSDDSQHLDIIEIDAASNRRIDEIRDLREKSRLAPTSAKYKVYIIDEVHMLTKEAFNALLKTLEEPPAHVIFILATTELHKLPATIVSRTQRFAFRPINDLDMSNHLKNIAKLENIKISDEAIDLITHHAGGGFRDAISLLDQARNTSKSVSVTDIEDVLGRPKNSLIKKLLNDILNSDQASIFTSLESLYSSGYSASIITESLLLECHKALRVSFNQKLLDLIDQLLKVELSINKNIALELAILRLGKIVENIVVSNPKEEKTPKAKNKTKKSKIDKNTPHKSVDKDNNDKAKIGYIGVEDFDTAWASTLATIKKSHNTLHGILNSASAEYSKSDNQLTLGFRFPFHLKKASEVRNQEIIKNALLEQTSEHIGLQFIKQAKEKSAAIKTVSAEKRSSDSVISTVIDVFGGGEVVGK